MIATARGLVVLAAIAAVLLGLTFVVGPPSRAPVDHALVPGFDANKITDIVFFTGESQFAIKRVGAEWRTDKSSRRIDAAAIDRVLTALRGGRWHRRSDGAGPGKHDLGDGISFGGTTLRIGQQLDGTGQTWIIRNDKDQVLVDDWIASALAMQPLDLIVRHPLDCASAKSVVAATAAGELRIAAGRIATRNQYLDPAWRKRVDDACAAIEIVALDAGTRTGQGLHVIADDDTLDQRGTCAGGRVFVETSSGEGCVEAAAVAALADLVAQLLALQHETIDRRPLPVDPAKLVLADGSVLDLAARPRIGDADADAEQVRELLRALTSPGDATLPRPERSPRGKLVATARDGEQLTLELFDLPAGHAIARAGEPGAIAIRDAEWAIITRPAAALRDATRWREDVTTIRSIELDRITYTRGAVLGEWTRAPAGAIDPTLVDALAETLASVRAPAATSPAVITHRLRVTFAPPAGAPATHAIELGAPSDRGCAGRLDGVAVQLPLDLCTATVALAAQR